VGVVCSHLTHSFKDPAPTCKHYKCKSTIEHILCTCTKYQHITKQYCPNTQLLHVIALFVLYYFILNFDSSRYRMYVFICVVLYRLSWYHGRRHHENR